jgi:hypothetical protein
MNCHVALTVKVIYAIYGGFIVRFSIAFVQFDISPKCSNFYNQHSPTQCPCKKTYSVVLQVTARIHKWHRISKLKKVYRLVRVPSKGGLSLSSGSLSSSSKSSLSSGNTTEDEESTSKDFWADILGSNWRGRGILGSETNYQPSYISNSNLRWERLNPSRVDRDSKC